MPAVYATSTSLITLEDWYQKNPCPQTGTGTQAVHRWLLTAANACRRYGRTAEQACDFITCGVAGCGRHVESREIRQAVEKAYNKTTSGNGGLTPPKPKWPDANLEFIEKIVADANGFGIADLRERSPIQFPDDLPHSVEVVETLLGCDDETPICVGASNSNFVTGDFRSLRGELRTATQNISMKEI